MFPGYVCGCAYCALSYLIAWVHTTHSLEEVFGGRGGGGGGRRVKDVGGADEEDSGKENQCANKQDSEGRDWWQEIEIGSDYTTLHTVWFSGACPQRDGQSIKSTDILIRLVCLPSFTLCIQGGNYLNKLESKRSSLDSSFKNNLGGRTFHWGSRPSLSLGPKLPVSVYKGVLESWTNSYFNVQNYGNSFCFQSKVWTKTVK